MTPSRVTERARCALARILFRITTVAGRVSTASAPKGHPWRLLVTSALHDLHELTTATLRARAADGVPTTDTKKGKATHWKAVLVTYLLVSQFVPLLPSVVFYHGDAKLYPLSSTGIVHDKVIAPRLRVYITPNRPAEKDLPTGTGLTI